MAKVHTKSGRARSRRGRAERGQPEIRHGEDRRGTVSSRSHRSTRLGGLRLGLLLLVALRICLGLVAMVAVNAGRVGAIHGQWEDLVISGGRPWSDILSTWQRWDALWYQHIAQEGYAAGDGSTAFFPLYPFLSRVVSIPLGGQVVLAELLVSSAAFVVAMWLLYRLAAIDNVTEAGPRTGRLSGPSIPQLAVLLTALSPVGFFFLAPYTESLFLALTLAAFWLARSGRPWAAGLAGFLASLTRAQGVFLALPLAFEYLRQRDVLPWIARRGGRPPSVGLLASALPALGLAAAMAFQRIVVGSRGSALDTYAQWGYQVVPPWEALSAGWRDILAGGAHGNLPEIEALNLVSLVGFGLLAVVAARRLPAAYALYTFPSLALLFTHVGWFSPLGSNSRYMLVLFPCFILLALFLARRPRLAFGWLAVSVLLQVVLFQFWTRWGFVA